MKHQNFSYFAAGLFVLAMFAGLIGTLFYLTGRTGPSEDYHVYYEDVAGLVKGTPVTFRGFRVGRLAHIEPEFDGTKVRYRVTLTVSEGWPISTDSVASIVSSGLLSSINIDISGGKSDQRLEPGSVIAGREAVSMFAALDSIAGEADRLVDDGIMPVLANLNARINGIADPLESGATQLSQDLTAGAATLRKSVDSLSGGLSEFLERLNNSAGNLQKILNDENREHIASFLSKMDDSATHLQRLSVDIQQSRAHLDTLLIGANGLVTDNRANLAQAVGDLKSSMASVAQNVDAIAYNLKITSRNMAEFSRLIRQNPGLLLSNRSTASDR